MSEKRVVIIGSGIGGLGTACLLSKAGYQVDVFEKNEQVGGRASVFSENGYTFDMGPSWYLMPDVFADFFSMVGADVSDLLSLVKLDPSYRIFFKDKHLSTDVFADPEKNRELFERLEPGSFEKFKEFLSRAAVQYDIAKDKFMYKNYDSVFDFFTLDTLLKGSRLSVFTSMDRYVKRFFKSPELQKIMQYTLVFLGSSPYNTPALYSIMSHIDFNMGVFYPMGGIYRIIEALKKVAEGFGARFHVQSEIKRILTEGRKATGVELATGEVVQADMIISNADIHHTETQLLPAEARSFSDAYWSSRVLAPSALVLYLGIDGRLPSLTHHNLIFSQDWERNFQQIFDKPRWPEDPSMYICAPSVTDPSVAPPGKENLFVLVPIAAGLDYTEAELEQYSDRILQTIERETGIPDLRQRIEFKRVFCVKDFASRYHSQAGTALGLAHTLTQTAIFRPDTKSKKLSNLYYVGAGTNPGIGMPICLISAELVYKRIIGNRSPSHLTSI